MADRDTSPIKMTQELLRDMSEALHFREVMEFYADELADLSAAHRVIIANRIRGLVFDMRRTAAELMELAARLEGKGE